MKLISEEQQILQRLKYHTFPVSAGDEEVNFASEQKKKRDKTSFLYEVVDK